MPDLPDIDALIARIRDRALSPPFAEPTLDTTGSDCTPLADVDLVPLPLTLDELLVAGTARQFVDEAYRLLMGRPVDPAGLETALTLLRAGHSRTYLFGLLQASPEARARGIRLPLQGAAGWVFRVCRHLHARSWPRVAGGLDRGYHAWRRLVLSASGRGARRLAVVQASLADRLAPLASAAHNLAQQTAQLVDLRADQDVMRHAITNLREHVVQHEGHIADVLERTAQDRAGLGALQGRLSAALETIQRQQQALDLLRLRFGAQQHQRVNNALDLDVDRSGMPSVPTAQPADIDTRLDAYYLAFEQAHRGAEEAIRDKQAGYLAHLADLAPSLLAHPMIDIGCGRGEWLRLLREQGFRARGIDLNPVMVAHCRDLGLDATLADALTWLRAQQDDSCALVSAFHVVEHLPFPVLFQLVEQAWRVLAPGGLLIFETPNPENVLVGSHTFYHDFSHRNPITPNALQFLVAYNGFDVVAVPRLSPYPEQDRLRGSSALIERFNGHFYGPQDYGIIARKPGLPVGADA